MRYNPNLEASELNGELLLFNGATNKFFVMNPTAAFVWNRLAEAAPANAEELASALCAHFEGATKEQALQDVKDTLSKLLELGLVLEH